MLNETERAGRHRYEIDRIVDECLSERVTFKVKSAFQRQKDTPGIKRGVLGGKQADMGLIMRAFQTVKESLGDQAGLAQRLQKSV